MRAFKTAFSELRYHPSRFMATFFAIVLSIAFLSVSQVFVGTESNAISMRDTAFIGKADAVVAVQTDVDKNGKSDKAKDRVVELLKASPDIKFYEPGHKSFASVTGKDTAEAEVYVRPKNDQLRWFEAKEGRLPDNKDEIMITRQMAKTIDANLGDQISISIVPQKLKVVGFTHEYGTFTTPVYLHNSVTEMKFENSSPFISSGWLVVMKDKAKIKPFLDSVKKDLKSRHVEDRRITASTADDYRKEAIKNRTGDFDMMSSLLAVFGAIALLVGGIIIANTFSILVQQRRRQVGLLRAVGATRGQVWGRFIAESFLLGLFGSAAGIGIGIGISAIISSYVTHAASYGLALPWDKLALIGTVGILVTVLSSLLPIRKAMQVTPLEALQPVSTIESARRYAWLRAAICALLLLSGLAVVWLGIHQKDPIMIIAEAMAGSVLVTFGVLGSASLYVPAMLRVFGLLFAPFGSAARLASKNSARNPSRAGATATALMLAVGLIVTLQVASATVKSSAVSQIEDRFPIDVTVRPSWGVPALVGGGSEEPNPAFKADAVSKVKSVQGISEAIMIKSTGSINIGTKAEPRMGMLPLMLVPDDLKKLSDNPIKLEANEVAVNTDVLKSFGFKPGQEVTLSVDHPTPKAPESGNEEEEEQAPPPPPPPLPPLQETVKLKLVSSAMDGGWASPALIEKLKLKAEPRMIFASLANKNDVAKVSKSLRNTMIIDYKEAIISGGAVMKAMTIQILDMMMLIVTGLLGVAALIALIGVGNTLGLSVLERTRESALLRALGLQSLGLRWMLLVEAFLLSLVGLVVGVGFGIGFGWLGALSALKAMKMDEDMTLSLDWKLMGIVVLIALGAGILSSILPGRKAAKAMPVEALADIG